MPDRPELLPNPAPLAYRLAVLSNHYTGTVYRHVREAHGIERSDFTVVFCLQTMGEMSAHGICTLTGRPRATISRAVKSMLERGFITRRSDPLDPRRAVLRLTPRGMRLFREVAPLLRRCEEAMLEPLSARDRTSLMRILELLVARAPAWADTCQPEPPIAV